MRKNDAVYEFGKKILATEYFVCLIHNFFKYQKFAVITSLFIMSLIPLTAYADSTLNVTLKNAINDSVLPDQKITVFEKLTDGSIEWTGRSNTDSNGKVAFDIDGIDDGRTFVLKASPYNAGSVYSDDLTSSGNYDFLVGKVELTLINGATGERLPDTKVYARRILDDGTTEGYKYLAHNIDFRNVMGEVVDRHLQSAGSIPNVLPNHNYQPTGFLSAAI